jgi:putative transposase
MPRARAILQSEFPYNIGARCINKEWFNLPLEDVWKIFCDELERTTQDHNLLVHSFVLMSNHFHLIASTPNSNISVCMQQFMQRSSKRLTRAGNRINETFAGRHYKCVLQSHKFYLNAYKYNYRNPVTAKICDKVEDYHFSTLQFVMNPSTSLCTIAEDTTFQFDPAGTLAWLNTEPNSAKLEGVRYGLKRQYFRSKLHRWNGSPLIGQDDLL